MCVITQLLCSPSVLNLVNKFSKFDAGGEVSVVLSSTCSMKTGSWAEPLLMDGPEEGLWCWLEVNKWCWRSVSVQELSPETSLCRKQQKSFSGFFFFDFFFTW